MRRTFWARRGAFRRRAWWVVLLPVWVAVAAVAAPAAEGLPEWPRFRGPNGEGVAEADSIPTQWTPADYRWRVKLPGEGHSSPVVHGDRLFVTAGLPESGARVIRCLRVADGGLIWKQEFASSVHKMHAFNNYAVATPALDGRNVYLTWADPEHYVVVALDQQKGRELWRQDLGPFAAEHGFGASPAVFENLLIVPNDQDGPSGVVALDCATGGVVWRTPRAGGRAAYSTPCLLGGDGPPQLLMSSTASGLTSLDPRTGRVLWQLADVFDQRVVGSPMVAAGLVFAACGTGGSGTRLIAVRPGDAEGKRPPEIAYNVKGSLPYVCTPVAHGPLVFLWYDQGVVTCLEAASGEVVWRERVGGKYFGSPVRVGDRLYCMSREGEMVVLAAERQYRLLARIDLGEPTHATPAVADGVMYLRTLTHLMALGGKNAP